MKQLVVIALVASCGGFSDFQPDPPAPRTVKEAFDLYPGGGAEDIAVLANGDIVVVGCESNATFVMRLERATRTAVWTRRSSSPCTADNWSVPRVTVSSTGTIWVAAFGWGRGWVPQEEARDMSMSLLAFDERGTLGEQRDLGDGLRVRAMTPLAAGRIAIAGQSAIEQVKSTAFVAAIDADGVDVWRTKLPHAYATFVESLAVDGENIYVGGDIDGTIEVVEGVGRGREGTGFVTTLRANTGAIASTWSRHYAGTNMDDVKVAVADGVPYVAYGVSQRVGNAWPTCTSASTSDCLPAMPTGTFTAIVVEPLATKPAWRRVFAGSTHTSVEDLAGVHDRLALIVGAQHGDIDFGRGAWHSDFFDLGAFVELSIVDGSTRDARRMQSHGENSRAFLRRVLWDGAAFTAVGGARGNAIEVVTKHSLRDESSFVWRLGT